MRTHVVAGADSALGVVLLSLFTLASSEAQSVRISEFMAANATVFPDNHDFDDYSDWIELENTGGSPVNLGNYFLSDDPSEPLKWRIPAGATIPANGFLVVRADGFDAAPGETHVREFSPWDNFRTVRYHTNFKLAAGGESVVLSKVDSPAEDAVYLALGASWRYFDEGGLPAPEWFAPSYSDAAWPVGTSEFGYGDGDEATVINFGSDSRNKYPTTYFRTTFEVEDPAGILELRCRAMIDDGAVIYVNGTEVARIRMPSGPIGYGTYSGPATENVYDELLVPKSVIVKGTNLIAVEVHQTSASSSDVSFNLELSASWVVGTPEIVDSIDFGLQIDDVSYGRNPSDGDRWYFFGDPTPGAANTTHATLDRTPSGEVAFSPPGGFFSGAQSVSLVTDAAGATIRYTLDGSVPTSASPEYGGPISVTSTGVVRARTFEPGRLPGALGTHTYLIGEPTRPLPVVAYTVDPATFFDPVIGIYDNVHKGREAPNSLEYYAPDRSLAFKVNSGTKIGGENIWRFAQKPLNIAMRGKYGDDLISYRIFPSETLGVFDAIGFRNGGDNWDKAMLRDPMAPSIVRGQMDNDVAYYRPAVLYLNGRYWGIHNVRLRMGDSYFASRYQISPGGYDLLVKEHTINGTELVVNEGTADAYIEFEQFIEGSDMAVPENYAAAQERMDLDNFMDYCAMVDFVYESSWHHNQEFWRERREGAKWRWNINDIDRGFNISNVTSSLLDDLKSRHPIFDSLRANPSFVNRFAQRYAAHLSSTFHPERIADIIDTLAAEVDPEIQRHINRWKAEGGIQSLASRQAELDEIKQFAADRAVNVFSDMATQLGLTNSTANLGISIAPGGSGRVLVNGVPVLPDYSTTVKLYRNIAFELTAEPAPGFVFAGWNVGGSEATISRTLAGNSTITANFQPSGESLIPAVVDSDTTLASLGSPYTAIGDITVKSGSVLTLKAGITIRMPAGASIHVLGALQIEGTETSPVVIEPRAEGGLWGGIGFFNATGASTLSHFKLVGATMDGSDPVNLKAAVSGLNSTIVIDHAEISAPLPIFARGGSTTVRFSRLHPQFTGDGVNVKGGSGLVEDCAFFGNDAPDTDAIDFDNVVDGVIRRNRIYGFRGSNSDAIDIGEGCANLLVEGNRIYNSSDKGVSVGQGSVVTMRGNLVVGCELGVGVKDNGSTAFIDQNTFVGNGVAVAVYEKNFGKGGGVAHVTNTIFSRSKDADATVDALSELTVGFSLSDTLALPDGPGNLLGDPLFSDAGRYDFSILPGSAAIDSGDPSHMVDPDGSRADMGAGYVYDPDDYPFHVPNVVVINEILAHSTAASPGDWIELYNTSASPVDIGGWYLSDSGSDLRKYRIADGTTIPGHGYVVFTEAEHFGAGSGDPGSMTAFALSENGETVSLFGPGDDLLLDYLESESFGPSASDVSKGRYFKSSTNTYNFVALTTPSPGQANGPPKVGPVVISEIMYHPENGDAEYLELHNIAAEPVTLYDAGKDAGWQVSEGIEYTFPSSSPVVLLPGEYCLLVRYEPAFRTAFEVPPGTQVYQWAAGGLNNGGEKIEISSPGDVDDLGVRQFIREDRVDYEDVAPWPAGADGGGYSLTRIHDGEYGNDPANWVAARPSPGQASSGLSGFEQWALDRGLPSELAGPMDDPDADGQANLIEYAFGTDPTAGGGLPASVVIDHAGNEGLRVGYLLSAGHPELRFVIEWSEDLSPGSWVEAASSVSPAGDGTILVETVGAAIPDAGQVFYRLRIEQGN